MKIVIFGATGGTGRALVEQALTKNHQVTAFVRDPNKLSIQHKNLKVIQGDVLSRRDVETAVKGHDGILSALGQTKNTPKNLCTAGVKNIIAAMKKHKLKRIIAESAFGAGETRNKGFYAKALSAIIPTRLNDKEGMEETLEKSNLEWIIVRPTILTNGPKTGRYHTQNPIRLLPTISRADVADFMLKQLTSNTFLHKTPTLTY